jgi:hypothetical protein
MKKSIAIGLIMVIFGLAGNALASMDTLTVQTATYEGFTPSYASAADTIYVPNNGATFVEFKNTNGSVRIVTMLSHLPALAGYTVTNEPDTLAATTGDRIICPTSQKTWADATTGWTTFILNATDGVTVAAWKINQ